MKATLVLGLLLGPCWLPTIALAACEIGGGARRFSDKQETVAKAQRCAAGDVGSCRSLDWIAGVGPADLRDIPDALAAEVERVLAPLCDREDAVACSERELILVRLGRRDEALKMYRARCGSDWSQCFDAGALELEARHLEEALKLFKKVCDEVRDGDGGGSCTCAGRILERRSRRAEAHAFYTRGCEDGDNDACASANRLSGRKVPRGSWEGLYRSQQGTVWIKDGGGGRIAVHMDTHWANGHECGYSGEGTVSGDVAQLASRDDEGCHPVLERNGRKLSVRDPGHKCEPGWCGARGRFEETFVRDSR